jgi:hypothetical protein
MEAFITKHRDLITATLSCFDRILFKGYLPLPHGRAMEAFLAGQGVLIKDFGTFVQKQQARLRAHTEQLAQQSGRPLQYLSGRQRKEQLAEQIARRDGITDGLICILAAVEHSPSFRVVSGAGRPRLESARRQGRCYYFYYEDRELGRLSIRLQTWFPFTIQVCINGHDWLAAQMRRRGLDFLQEDNAFVALGDPARAQKLADTLPRKKWPRILNGLAARVNPLLGDLLHKMEYYWVVDQAEYATDLLFKDRAALSGLYPALLRQATLSFGAEEVMGFLGRRLLPQFQGELKSTHTRRVPGARIKHQMKANWIKMYDKQGRVLRIETVINQPREFRVRRKGMRKGREVMDWFPLSKGVCYLWCYAQVARAANARYLEALAAIENPAPAHKMVERVCEPVAYRGRRARGLSPLRREDLELFKAVMRGEHTIHGLRARDLSQRLGLQKPDDPVEARRQNARVSRKLHLLHAHGLLAKIPRSRRWRLTSRGAAVMGAAISYREEILPERILQLAA